MNKIMPEKYLVTCHTRHVGHGSTFVAIDGFRKNGTVFIDEAISRGAKKIVLQNTSENVKRFKDRKNVEICFVDDCRKVLAELSSESLGHPSKKLKIIGITGTAGKTTTAFLTKHLLTSNGYKTALLGSIKNEIIDEEIVVNMGGGTSVGGGTSLTTPESDFLHTFFDRCVKNGVTHVVMEVSSHSIAQKRVHGILFDVVIFTNLSPEHLDFHKNMDDYFKTKCKLFSQVKKTGRIFVNGDDVYGKRAIDEYKKGVLPIPVHLKNVNILQNDLFGIKGVFCSGKNIKNSIENRMFYNISNPFVLSEFCIAKFVSKDTNTFKEGNTFVEDYTFHVPTLFGTFNFYNVLMAVSAYFSITGSTMESYGEVRDSLKNFPGVPGRLQVHRLKNGATAFVDFAHKPGAFEVVLKFLRNFACEKELTVVFGCGGDRDKTKRPVMGRLASVYCDRVIVTDDNPRDEDRHQIIAQICDGIEDGFENFSVILDRKKAIAEAVKHSHSDSVISILGKGHESYYLCKGKKYYFNDFEEISFF